LILRILNLITRSGRQIPHATRSILEHHDSLRLLQLLQYVFTVLSNAISTWPSISTGHR
jgi:hypothetical protein